MLRYLRCCANLARNDVRGSRGQAAYLVVTLAVAVVVWLVLTALLAPLMSSALINGTGIQIGNGSQNASPLPLRYARRIEGVRGAKDVWWWGVLAVNCAGSATVPLYAYGGPGTTRTLLKHKISKTTLRRWQADPLGVVFSTGALAKCGWHVGQGIDPPSMVGSKDVALHIVGAFRGAFARGYMHYDYSNRAGLGMQGKDKVVTYFAYATDPRDDNRLAARFEETFAHDFPSVRARTNATTQNALARFGKVQQLLTFVMTAILLCAASVFVSVLAHATTQRKARLAVLQVLGFQRSALLGALALELCLVVVLGALVGMALAQLIGHELAPTVLGLWSHGARAPTWAWWGLPAWLAALVVAALAWPATVIARLRPADYRAI